MDVEFAAFVRLAPSVGDHAMALYFVSLATLLLLTGLLWWLSRSWMPPRETGIAPTPTQLMLRLSFGFGAIVLGAWVFAEIAEAMHAGAALGAADQALADAFRTGVPPAALQVFAMLTRLADTATLTALAIAVSAALVATGRRWLAFGWLAAVVGNALLNTTLKQIFERVRPVHDDGLVLAQGFSFPSGHSSGSVVVYGMLAYLAMRFVPRRWHLALVLAAVALAFSIGVSRMFLRVHFASDVVAGFASGSAWLAICIGSIELTRWYARRSA